ncbi:DUF397 domain-containing protein [Streptomyces sp. NPDC006289]|uniref:DUF397 domain-containing protein n=1 Tax=Streptomyces sp. NPDC006289 TaxID=3156744 RepID=UPI0033B7D6E0
MADVPAGLSWSRAAPEGAEGHGPWIEIAFGADDLVHLRTTDDPGTVVTTTTRKWDAFTRGVRAGEFDHFGQDTDPPGAPVTGLCLNVDSGPRS